MDANLFDLGHEMEQSSLKIMELIEQKKVEIIKHVLRKYLEREPTEEDFKKIEFFQDDRKIMEPVMCFDNKKFGTVTWFWNVDNKITVEFNPCDYADFLQPAVINGKANFNHTGPIIDF